MNGNEIYELRSLIHVASKTDIDDDERKKRVTRAKELFQKYHQFLSRDEVNMYQGIIEGQTFVIEANQKSKLVSEAITNRRSRREYGGELDKSDMVAINEAIKWQPTSCNRQPQQVIYIKDKSLIKQISEIKKQKFIEKSQTVILYIVDDNCYIKGKSSKYKEYFKYMDSGVGIQNILLTGEERDLSMCLVNCVKEESSQIKQILKSNNIHIRIQTIRNILNDNFEITGLIIAGKKPENNYTFVQARKNHPILIL